MDKPFNKKMAKRLMAIINSHEVYGNELASDILTKVKLKDDQILIRVTEGDFVDYLFLPMSDEQGYIVIRSIANRNLRKWEETDRWYVVSDGSPREMAHAIAKEVWELDGFKIPEEIEGDWDLNPRNNPSGEAVSGLFIAGLLGYAIGKKRY